MKTAISVPDDTFERATREAKRRGMSRSEFFSRAAERYLKELERADLTERINAALPESGMDESNQWAVEAGRRTLANAEW